MGARPPDTANSTGHVGLTDAGLSRACLTHAGLPKASPRLKCSPPFFSRKISPKIRRKFPIALSCFYILCATLAWSSLGNVRRVSPLNTSRNDDAYLLRTSEHVTESMPTVYSMCEDDQPPEPLLTPNPMVPFGRPVRVNDRVSDQVNKRINDRVNVRANDRINVRVSFLVGLDGQVQSAFVLDSGGSDDDSAVLRAVRGWRYRPARCNGVPTSSEIRVRFSIP